jgi:hemolysin activation/secretion protein
MYRRLGCLAAGVVLAVTLSSRSWAQQALPDLTQQQRHEYQQRQQELQRIEPPSAGVQLNAPQSQPVGGGVCMQINKIEVDGADHLAADEIQLALKPFLNTCLGLSEINKIVDTINSLYIEHGDVTSRAYIPQQDLRGGTLKIIAVEGHLQGFEFQGKPEAWHVEGAFPGLKGEVLNLRDLEQGLEQMNRLPGWNATMHVAPGSEPGSSVVIVTAPAAPYLSGRIWADNNGTEQTGRWDGHIAATLVDPLGLLDMYSAEYDRNVFPVAGGHASNYADFSGSIPHGYWTLFGDFNYSDYRYSVAGLVGVVQLTGWTQRLDLGVDRVLERGQTDKTTLELRYTHKQVSSSLDDVTLVTGSEALASVSARLSYTRRLWGGAWYGTLGLQWGLPPGEGTAQTLPVTAAYVPHAAYLKPSLDINAYQPFSLFGQSWVWEPSLHAEYATVREYTTDELQLGGLYTVRGFLLNTLSGDRGFYLHNDLTWNLPVKELPGGLQLNDGLYAGLDVGWTKVDAAASGTPHQLVGGALSGAVLGIRSNLGPLYADVSAAHALETGPLPPEGWIFTVQAGVSF